MKKKIDLNKALPIIIVLIVVVAIWFSMSDNFKNTEIFTNNKDTMADNTENTKVKLETNYGDIVIELYSDMPITTSNFINLAKSGTYDGVIFHRIIPNFMIQGGDPTGTGMGDPKIPKIQDEFVAGHSNVRGTISMANAGPNTGSSQFFINLGDNSQLDYDKIPFTSKHPVFGEVVEGMDVVDKIASVQTGAGDRPVEEVKMIKVTVL